MSERPPTNEQFSPNKVVDFWRTTAEDLPGDLTNGKNTTEVAELLKLGTFDLDSVADENGEYETEMNDLLRENLEEGSITLGEFWKIFKPSLAKELDEGRLTAGTSLALMPFVANSKNAGAWSKMCEDHPTEVNEVIIAAAILDEQGAAGVPNIDGVNFGNNLRTLGKYLDKKGVPLTWLNG